MVREQSSAFSLLANIRCQVRGSRVVAIMAPDEGFFFFGKLEPLNVVAGVLADDKKLVVWQPLEAAAVKD